MWAGSPEMMKMPLLTYGNAIQDRRTSPFLYDDGHFRITIAIYKKLEKVHLQSVNHRYLTLMMEPYPNENVILRTNDGEEIKAFMSILSANSRYFSRMFATEWKEKEIGVFNVQQFSGVIMRQFLQYLCVGEVESLGLIDKELYKVADVYLVEKLKIACRESIRARTSTQSIAEIIDFASCQGDESLHDSCCIKLSRFFSDGGDLLNFLNEAELNIELRYRVLSKLLKWCQNELMCTVTI